MSKSRTLALLDVEIVSKNGTLNEALLDALLKKNILDLQLFIDRPLEKGTMVELNSLKGELQRKGFSLFYEVITPMDIAWQLPDKTIESFDKATKDIRLNTVFTKSAKTVFANSIIDRQEYASIGQLIVQEQPPEELPLAGAAHLQGSFVSDEGYQKFEAKSSTCKFIAEIISSKRGLTVKGLMFEMFLMKKPDGVEDVIVVVDSEENRLAINRVLRSHNSPIPTSIILMPKDGGNEEQFKYNINHHYIGIKNDNDAHDASASKRHVEELSEDELSSDYISEQSSEHDSEAGSPDDKDDDEDASDSSLSHKPTDQRSVFSEDEHDDKSSGFNWKKALIVTAIVVGILAVAAAAAVFVVFGGPLAVPILAAGTWALVSIGAGGLSATATTAIIATGFAVAVAAGVSLFGFIAKKIGQAIARCCRKTDEEEPGQDEDDGYGSDDAPLDPDTNTGRVVSVSDALKEDLCDSVEIQQPPSTPEEITPRERFNIETAAGWNVDERTGSFDYARYEIDKAHLDELSDKEVQSKGYIKKQNLNNAKPSQVPSSTFHQPRREKASSTEKGADSSAKNDRKTPTPSPRGSLKTSTQ